MGVLTEVRLRDLLSKGLKEVLLEKGTIITPAARDFAREAGIELIFGEKQKVKEVNDSLPESGPDESESNSSQDCQYDQLIAKVAEITKQKLGENPMADEVITKVVATLMRCQLFFSRFDLLARSSGGKGVDVTLPSGGQCTLGLVSLARGESWQLQQKSLLLVATGKVNILPDRQLAGAGDGCQVDAGCEIQALDDSTFFCIQ
ncbi:MAG: hypothetical protein ACN4A7_08695 [Thermacetogeniaceae bacterium]|nr:hypothetical protein [Thermoanaerobacterales bacterium]NLN21216.1 hypothetical protein [Syntrophomonadaceae bacterium]